MRCGIIGVAFRGATEEGALDRGADGRTAFDDGLEPPVQGGTVEEDAAATLAATDADVRAHAYDVPVEAAAGVFAAQAEHVADTQIEDHASILQGERQALTPRLS